MRTILAVVPSFPIANPLLPVENLMLSLKEAQTSFNTFNKGYCLEGLNLLNCFMIITAMLWYDMKHQ